MHDARNGLNFPDRVRFHDTTLRDGELQAGITFTHDDKVTIARRLARAGVDRIEVGLPRLSREDEAAVNDIVAADLGPEIFAFCRCVVEDVKAAKACGVHGVMLETPNAKPAAAGETSSVQRSIGALAEATLAAKDNGLRAVLFTMESSRMDFDRYVDFVARIASEGHIDALALVDTFGVVSPHAVPMWVTRVRRELPGIPLECHFHDDFGLALANSIAALATGVEVVHTTVSGIGQRAGNTAMEELALGLQMLYGVAHGLKTNEFFALSRLVCERAGHRIPSNRRVTGERLFEVEAAGAAAIFASGGGQEPTKIFPYSWNEVGQSPGRIVYGTGSGIPSVAAALAILGLRADETTSRKVLAEIKARSLARKSLLPFEEVACIIRDLIREAGDNSNSASST